MVGCKETGKTIYADESFSISKSFYFIQKTYKLKDESLYNMFNYYPSIWMCHSRNHIKYSETLDQNKSFQNILFHNQFL